MNTLPITAIVLTHNEELNIKSCLESIHKDITSINIVDSNSSDDTINIVKQYTDNIYKNNFENYAKQFMWAIQNTPINTPWIMRLDADERWTPEALEELASIITDESVNGVYVKMRIYFMNKWIRHGGFYPNYFLRVFRKEKGTIENRFMDEHIKISGKTVILKNDINEYNLKDRNRSISEFIKKHNAYSTREAIEILCIKHNLRNVASIADPVGSRTARKRWAKENIYLKLPMFLRAFLYFIYRYVFQFGYLDGKVGLIFHFLQGFWYRFLADVKVYEIEKTARKENKEVRLVVKDLYNIVL